MYRILLILLLCAGSVHAGSVVRSPNAAGHYSQLTPSPAVANYLNVDDVSSDDASTTNYTSVDFEIDCYAFPVTGGYAVPADSAIDSVTVYVTLANEGGCCDTAWILLRNDSAGANYYPESASIGFSYVDYTCTWTTNPTTDTAWIPADANNVIWEAGVICAEADDVTHITMIKMEWFYSVPDTGGGGAVMVDTLSDTSEVYDAFLTAYTSCNPEVTGENCLRYNKGGTEFGWMGASGLNMEYMVMSLPGWDQTMPDSSELWLYCNYEPVTTDKSFACYPLTASFIEGTEAANYGDYPDPDSGVTYNHRYLDDGVPDSLSWSVAGGDYTTGVACTATVTGVGWFSFPHFERILNYMDTSGTYYGWTIRPISTPVLNNGKRVRASETTYGTPPMVILYSTEEAEPPSGCRRRKMLSE